MNSYDNPGFQEDVDIDTSYENSGSSEVGLSILIPELPTVFRKEKISAD